MLPLEDVRVIALEQYGAGPWASVHLADLGAEIIKIEDPSTGGDVARYVPPYQEGNDSLFFQTFNRNKESVSLDMSTSAGREVFCDLVARSDAVFSNLRGDVPAKLRIRYEDLCGINPKIVCCNLSAYGSTGPRAKDPGYDYMIQGIAGWMSVTGEPGGPPTKTGLSLVDFSGGFVAALSLLVGIHAARRDGVGMDCDVSLLDTAIGLLNYTATWHLTRGYTPTRTRNSAHPSLVPFQNFRTQDGWVVVGCAKEKFWHRLTEIADFRTLGMDPRFEDFASRREHAPELLALLENAFATRPTAEWIEQLSDAGVPCAPVNSVAEALNDPQVVHRELLIESAHPDLGAIRTVASPVRVGDHRPANALAPAMHADADHVLRELLGYATDRVAELSRAGAFGPQVDDCAHAPNRQQTLS